MNKVETKTKSTGDEREYIYVMKHCSKINNGRNNVCLTKVLFLLLLLLLLLMTYLHNKHKKMVTIHIASSCTYKS